MGGNRRKMNEVEVISLGERGYGKGRTILDLSTFKCLHTQGILRHFGFPSNHSQVESVLVFPKEAAADTLKKRCFIATFRPKADARVGFVYSASI
jgi:hypothetical protein